MKKNLVGAISALLLYGFAITNSHAGLALYGALTSGGDTLATAFDEDGDDYDLKAGGLIHLAVGYEKRFESGGGMRITCGYKFDTLDADNGDAEFTRYPLEAAFYKTLAGRHNIGGGLVYEMSPRYKDDFLGSLKIDFDDAAGLMVFYGYLIGFLEWGVRYTDIEYEYRDFFTVDGSNYGLYISSFFE